MIIKVNSITEDKNSTTDSGNKFATEYLILNYHETCRSLRLNNNRLAMKHIRRKFSGQLKIPGIINTLYQLKKKHPHLNTDIKSIPPRIPDGMKGILFTDKEEMFYAFSFVEQFQGRNCMVPEPDPTLVYFNIAQRNYRFIITQKGRSELIDLLANLPNADTSKVMHSLYDFLGESSTFVTSLFMAMESAVNKTIPDNYELRKPENRKTIIYDNLQVQHLEFKEKNQGGLTCDHG